MLTKHFSWRVQGWLQHGGFLNAGFPVSINPDSRDTKTGIFKIEVLDQPNYQGNAAVKYTDAETPWTRIIEHKWFEYGKDDSGNELPKTVISKEFSSEWKPGDEPYYPVNDKKIGNCIQSIKL